jgi:putative restriction endonuclease
MIPTRTRTQWTEDELLIVCGLYFTLPFGRMHKTNPQVVHIASLIDRTPSSVAMKLTNFASLDPAHQARGVRGLSGHSHADLLMWNRFANDWAAMACKSEQLLLQYEGRRVPVEPPKPATVVTEETRLVTVRLVQGLFRKIVLAAYDNRCCVTGNPVEELLNASHILPWSDFESERLNPSNGLCLAAHFDRAFDRALIAFDDNMRLLVGDRLKRQTKNISIQQEFCSREGTRIALPERFPPNPDFLAHHRRVFFADRNRIL